MDEINVILISSVRPERSMSGALILHRHLMNRSGIRLHILPAEHHEIVHGRFHSKIVPRLMRTAARRWAGDIDYLMHTALPLEKQLAAPPPGTRRVVLTLAYRSGCWVAQRYARRHRLPLIVRLVALASEPPEQADSASEPPSTTAATTRPEALRGARFTGDDRTWCA